MKNLIKLIIVLSLFLSFACEDPHKDTVYRVYDELPISAYLDSRSDEFSEWIAIMEYADMYNAINHATSIYTLFAPDNEAVKAFYAKYQIEDISALGYDYARELVKTHLVSDSLSRDDFMKGGVMAKKTVADNFLTVSFGEGGYGSVYLNEQVRVKELALSASNGLVYTLDGVMRPLIEGLFTQMEFNGKHTILVDAMKMTGWNETLDIISTTATPPGGTPVETRHYYTVLGVSDEVFQSKGISSVNDLISYLSAGSDYKEPANALNQYVGYHVLKGSYQLENLKKFDIDTLNVRLWETASNTLIKITREDESFYLNTDAGEANRAQFKEKESNYLVRNGYIHELDNILPVTDKLIPVSVYFDVTNFPEVASYINSNAIEGMIYQTAVDAEKQMEIPIDLACYSVVESPSGSLSATSGSGRLRYVTIINNPTHTWANSLFKDFLLIGLGRQGSITMKTPPILPGNYKITLHYVYANSMNKFLKQDEGNGGLTSFALTDMNISSSHLLYSSLPSTQTMGLCEKVIFDEVTFNTQKAHDLRITLDDAVASSSKDYRIQIDYIHFEPINN